MTFINSVEWANAAFNPFDLNLDGWGEQVSEDIDSYDEIFSELYDKYKGGKMAPELQLLLRIGFSAAMVNFTNRALSSATPGFNDVIKQSPQLMKMFTEATTAAMSQQSPAFQFASNLMNKPEDINTSFGPPPAPVETKKQPRSVQPKDLGPPTNRQDINAARGAMFRESGVNVQQNYASVNESTKTIVPPQPRAEMRGPSSNPELDSILMGLKKMPPAEAPVSAYVEDVDDSMISISSLKDLAQNNSVPKSGRGRRKRNTSEQNTIRLDI
jgi:hypothetical protein